MPFNYSVQLNDPTNAGGTSDAVLVADLQQALSVWSRYISGAGTLVVDLTIADTSSGRESGGPTSSQFLWTTGGINVFEPSSLYELTTGQHVANTTSDITITVSPGYFKFLDLAPGLTYDSQVPGNEYNPIVVFLHELTHGFGMSGWYTQAGTLSTAESIYDTFVQITPSGASFTGSHAEAVFGGPVTLTSSSTAGENYYHFGNTLTDISRSPSTVQDPLTLDLMNGVVLFFDYQYQISNLDLAVLRDLGYRLTDLVADDFTGTRVSDVLWTNTTTGDVETWLMTNGQLSGGTGVGFVSSAWQMLGTGDINGDGASDVLWRNSNTGEVDSWLISNDHMNGGTGVGSVSSAWQCLGTGDFNGDGTGDVLWRNNSGEVDTWLLNNGHVAGGGALGAVSSAWRFAGVGDFNGDGTSDVLWHNATTGEVDTWLVNNEHLSGGGPIGAASSAWQCLGAGDFNGDGVGDILWRNLNTGEVDTWLMNNGHVTGGAALGAVSSAWQFAGIGDYAGNGTSDALWRNLNTGEVDTWLITNDRLSGGSALSFASTAWQPQVIQTG